MLACHAGDRGSIPRRRISFAFLHSSLYNTFHLFFIFFYPSSTVQASQKYSNNMALVLPFYILQYTTLFIFFSFFSIHRQQFRQVKNIATIWHWFCLFTFFNIQHFSSFFIFSTHRQQFRQVKNIATICH